jgi:hypothetical protein
MTPELLKAMCDDFYRDLNVSVSEPVSTACGKGFGVRLRHPKLVEDGESQMRGDVAAMPEDGPELVCRRMRLGLSDMLRQYHKLARKA